MKEHPIIFSGPMVRAILDGKKTQTRRVLKTQPPSDWLPTIGVFAPTKVDRHGKEIFGASDESFGVRCPYGQPGHILWVKETFDWVAGTVGCNRFDKTIFKADGCKPISGKWTSSLFMPSWASRITLEITDVRVQRVQEITACDVLEEGVQQLTKDGTLFKFAVLDRGDLSSVPWQDMPRTPIEAYKNLWDSLNAKRGFSWESNPWGWAITFKRLT